MLSGLILIAAVVLLGQSLGSWGIVPLAVTIGVLAGLVQMLGLLRWVYLVPSIARTYSDPSLEAGQREASLAVFRAMHQYLGVGVGEHLGYLFTGTWSVLIGVAIARRDVMPSWLGWIGVVVGAGLTSAPPSSWVRTKSTAGGWPARRIPILYIVWSIWLLAMGIALVA